MSVHVTSESTVVSESGSLDYPRILYDNLARLATITASSEQEGFPADSAAAPDTYSYWKPSAVQAWWQADLGAAVTVNSIGIAAHNLGSLACSVRAQHSSDGVAWSNASDREEPTDNSAMLLLFPEQTSRYWRFLFDGVGSPTAAPAGMPAVGVIYVGESLVMQRTIYGGHQPITLSRDTVLQQNLSSGGQFLGQNIRRSGFVGGASFRYLTPSWYRSSFDPFVQSARRYPYFFAWRPGDYPNEVAYAWTGDDIHPSNMGLKDFMQVAWSMRGHSDLDE